LILAQQALPHCFKKDFEMKLFSKNALSRSVVALAMMGSLGFASMNAQADDDKVLNFVNWTDYIGEDTIANFEKEFGIKVNYTTLDNNEVLNARLIAGHSGYDLAIPSATFAKSQIDGGLLMKLDKSQLPNLKNYDQSIVSKINGGIDAGSNYTASWLWGFNTVGINVAKVKVALGSEPMPANPLELVFNPKYTSKLKSCGVSFLDSPTEVVPTALSFLGKDPYSKNPADYTDALAMLKSVRPYVTMFSSSGYIDEMANGGLCAAFGWSGDFGIARARAADRKSGQEIKSFVFDGAIIFSDVMVIPAEAPHSRNALLFINYVLRPEVHAAITNRVKYPNANAAAKKFVAPDILKNSYPSPEEIVQMKGSKQITTEMRKLANKVFSSFKSGM
jgi:putrescine transport system substrate-binding protein